MSADVLCDEDGCFLSWDERSGDDDVTLLSLTRKQIHLSLDELWAHFLGVTTLAFARFLKTKTKHLHWSRGDMNLALATIYSS